MAKGESKAPTSAVHVDDEAGTVAIGATFDGVFVPFYTLPKSQVDAHVATAKLNEKPAADDAE